MWLTHLLQPLILDIRLTEVLMLRQSLEDQAAMRWVTEGQQHPQTPVTLLCTSAGGVDIAASAIADPDSIACKFHLAYRIRNTYSCMSFCKSL